MEFNGSDFKASIVGTPNKPIQKTRDLSLDIATEELDITTRDSGGWKLTLAGVRSWNASMSGTVDWVEGSTSAGIKSLLTLKLTRAEIQLTFGTTATGDQSFSGHARILDIKFSTPHEGVCEWTAECSGNGPIVMASIV